MPCYSPLKGFRSPSGGISFSPRTGYVDVPMQVPCGRCIGCRLEHSRQWAVRIMHEASLHDENIFVTLTYDEEKLPADGSLRKADFQKFMKRLRKFYGKERISYFHCGEYGEENWRPHYHAILFGVDFPDKQLYKRNGRDEALYSSPTLTRLWGHGMALFGAVTFESAAYVARYCVKKVTGQEALHVYSWTDPETGEIHRIQPEYATMSTNPAIGRDWMRLYWSEVEQNDSVVMRGYEMKVPRYYDKMRRGLASLQDAKRRRLRRAYRDPSELTEARLKVKERVKLAQTQFLGRKLK